MSRDSQRHYSVEDYFKVEEMSAVKHEFCRGEIFAMAGASLPHNEIAANVLAELRAQLRESDCGAYGSDLRVQTPSGLYTYPDISVICGPAEIVPERPDTVVNPVVLVEVLSEATEEYERGEKFSLYKSMSTLRHCLLISQTEILVDHFQQTDAGDWHVRSLHELRETIELQELGVSIAIEDVYRRVF
jgi:Uma2 family endonuclease